MLLFLFVFISNCARFYWVNQSITLRPFTHFPEAIFTNAAIIAALISLLWLLPRRIRPWALFLFSASAVFLAYTDVLSYRYFTDIFSVANFSLLGQADDVASSIFSLFKPKDILAAADLPVLFLYAVFFEKARKTHKKRTLARTKLSIVIPICIIILGALVYYIRIAEFDNRIPGALDTLWDKPAVATSTGVLAYHVFEAASFIRNNFDKNITEEERETLIAWLKERNELISTQDVQGEYEGFNILVIQVEALQGFVLGAAIEGREVTPVLNNIAKNNIYFSDTFVQTALGNTSDAEFILNTSLFPAASGAVFTRFSSNTYHSLPKSLKERGYASLVFHANKPSFWNRQNMYRALGFDRFYSVKDFPRHEPSGFGPSDRVFFAACSEILRAQQEPFYALLVTLSSHHPFSFPNLLNKTTLDAGYLEGTFLGNYLKGINYTDAQIGIFLEDFNKTDMANRTIIVIYGDHAAISGASEELEKLLGQNLSGHAARKNLQKVPLIFIFPKNSKIPKNFKKAGAIAASQLDIGPTIAALLGVKMPYAMGENLFGEAHQGKIVFRNGSFIDGDVWADEGSGVYVNLKTGLPASSDKKTGEALKNKLSVSDIILKYDGFKNFVVK